MTITLLYPALFNSLVLLLIFWILLPVTDESPPLHVEPLLFSLGPLFEVAHVLLWSIKSLMFFFKNN